MCYFSNPEKRKTLHGIITDTQLDIIQKATFSRALKLQIGCGAEPTLYPGLRQLIERGRKSGIPYISLTTNGQLIGQGKIELNDLIDAGLNEITLSLHGTHKETYEELMPGAQFKHLTSLIAILSKAKKEHPEFKIRVNFTINSLNINDLKNDGFWHVWKDVVPDIIQLRPVQKIGESSWTDFNLRPIIDNYDATIASIIKHCKMKAITCMAPSREQLKAIDNRQDATSSIIEDITYCYVSPESCYKEDFNPQNETLTQYIRRKHFVTTIIKAALGLRGERSRNVSKKLNYTIK